MPYLVVTGEVNEKLQEMITKKIIPELKNNVAIKISEEQLKADPLLPRFTLVFDREAYSPVFFKELWDKHRIAVLTYNKNVKDLWEDSDFSVQTTKIEENLRKQSEIKEDIHLFEKEEDDLITQRKKQSYKITIKEMEENIRYNKLDIESKLFQNVIKMICYRAETAFSTLLASNYRKKTNEMRALTKSLIKTKVNLIPDYKNETLTIELYSLSNPRDNNAVKEICHVLNDSQTRYPGTNLTLIYKFVTE